MTASARRLLTLLALAALLALLTWGRIALIDHLHDHGWFTKYYELAGRAVSGHLPVDRLGDISPGYFWLMVAMRWIGLSVGAIRDLQIAGVTIAVILLAAAAWRLQGWAAAIAAAVLVLGNRSALVISTELEPETLILILNAAAILAIVMWQKSGTRTAAATAGLFIGLSTIARPVGMGFIVLVGLWMLLRSRASAVVFVVAALVPVGVIATANRALTGNLFIMQPGSQFYESNNPLASGCAGTLPRIVADLEATVHEPDYLHVAYRVIAARATGSRVDARLSNRYWTGKAMAFLRHYPRRAAELFAWKGMMSVHNYDIYDLWTTKMKAVELERYPAIPFGAIVVLATIAAFLHERRRELLPLALLVAATLFALVLFNVSARQRTALLAPAAVLAGVGVAAMIRLARNSIEKGLLVGGAFLIGTALLGIEGPPSLENDYVWLSSVTAQNLRDAAIEARTRGARQEAASDAAMASILNPHWTPLVTAPTLRAHALALASSTQSPRRSFDAAVALQKSGAWRESETVLRQIEEYQPHRDNRSPSSVAYYRARAAIHLHAPLPMVRALLDRALEEAPGDPDVLALRVAMGARGDAAILDAIHDPFTRDVALAGAYADLGDRGRADTLLARVQKAMPEWQRPATLRRALHANP